MMFKIQHHYSLRFALTLVLLAWCTSVHADSQILSVTPPLFQLSAVPGDVWQSSVKVVNGNPYPITIYPEVVNFRAMGEAGQGKFIPILEQEIDKTSLAHWIQISKGPRLIPPEQTIEVSFIVDVPKDASPGGHYAAILITTEPPQNESEKFAVQTAQTVTSLFFVRIEGDVHESGLIREFRALDSFLPRPEAEFSLRFENKGNVHLQPRGDIVISNMWGTERGIIPVNYQTHFGNVLPESIRDFKFTWKSDFSITDVGRYKAIATLGYGEDGVKSVSAVTYFWVIPVKATFITLCIVALFVGLIIWMVRMYVRRMLALAGVEVNSVKQVKTSLTDTDSRTILIKPKVVYKKVSAPLRDGVIDLRNRLSTVGEFVDGARILLRFIISYKMFFMSLAILLVIFVTTVLYFGKATEVHQNYEVIINEGEDETRIDGSDILLDGARE